MSSASLLRLSSGDAVPAMVYGTAWKKANTESLVTAALKIGFRGFDSANEMTNYEEAQVGKSITAAMDTGIPRNSLWLQTKFTPIVGYDREPFLSEQEPLLEEQIEKSIQQSLASFRTHIDILFLHTPFPTGAENLRAWRTFESYVPHQIRHLGVSNASLKFLQGLYERVLIKPEIVQNRFWAPAKFDVELRKFSAEKGIVYQGYGMLRFCDQLLKSRVVLDLAAKLGVKVELALYVLILRLGNFSILNGTSNKVHMEEDLSFMERVWVDVEIQEELQEYSVRFNDHLRLLIAEEEK